MSYYASRTKNLVYTSNLNRRSCKSYNVRGISLYQEQQDEQNAPCFFVKRDKINVLYVKRTSSCFKTGTM